MLGWLGLDLQVFRPRPFPLIALLTRLPSAALRLADGDLRGILHVAAIWIGVIFLPAARDPHHRLLRRRLRRWSGRRCGGRRRRRSRSRCNHRRGGRHGVWSRTGRAACQGEHHRTSQKKSGCSHIECDSVYRIRSDQCSAWQFHRRPYTYILHRFRWTDSEPCRRKLHLQYPIRRQPA